MSSSDTRHRGDTPNELKTVRALIRSQSTRIKERELETALRKLEASDSFSERDRAVIEEMADRIVTQLLKPPILALEEREDADPAELEALSRLFEQGTDRDSSE
ncbi:MAG: hypothetical protein ABEH88_04310 [Halobacteriales archaeon]